jgi:hypothetical protein
MSGGRVVSARAELAARLEHEVVVVEGDALEDAVAG